MAQREPQSSGWPSNLVRWPRPLALPTLGADERAPSIVGRPANVVAFRPRQRVVRLWRGGPPAA